MLVLTRKVGEGILIGDDVKITVVEVKGGGIRIGIDAPAEKKIYRLEVYDRIREENREATLWDASDLDSHGRPAGEEGAVMEKILTRFGEVEFDPSRTIHFVAGLIGFEDLHRFIVMPQRKESPLFWIQSAEDPQVAFVLTDPADFFPDYLVVPSKSDREKLQIGEEDECHVLAVATVSQDKKVTLNLAAPILFAPGSDRALQVILEDSDYQTRTPLPEIESEAR